jgi:hypothetical protein
MGVILSNSWQEGKAWITQLLAVACLSLASKMEETFVPLPLDLQVSEGMASHNPLAYTL